MDLEERSGEGQGGRRGTGRSGHRENCGQNVIVYERRVSRGKKVELKQNEVHLKGCMVLNCKKKMGEEVFPI